jgi:hypothetical protein
MLHDDRHVRFDQARVGCSQWYWFWIRQVVEPEMTSTPGAHGESVRPDRFPVGIENGQFNMGILLVRIEDAKCFMAGHFRSGTITSWRNISFRDYPALLTDHLNLRSREPRSEALLLFKATRPGRP